MVRMPSIDRIPDHWLGRIYEADAIQFWRIGFMSNHGLTTQASQHFSCQGQAAAWPLTKPSAGFEGTLWGGYLQGSYQQQYLIPHHKMHPIRVCIDTETT